MDFFQLKKFIPNVIWDKTLQKAVYTFNKEIYNHVLPEDGLFLGASDEEIINHPFFNPEEWVNYPKILLKFHLKNNYPLVWTLEGIEDFIDDDIVNLLQEDWQVENAPSLVMVVYYSKFPDRIKKDILNKLSCEEIQSISRFFKKNQVNDYLDHILNLNLDNFITANGNIVMQSFNGWNNEELNQVPFRKYNNFTMENFYRACKREKVELSNEWLLLLFESDIDLEVEDVFKIIRSKFLVKKLFKLDGFKYGFYPPNTFVIQDDYGMAKFQINNKAKIRDILFNNIKTKHHFYESIGDEDCFSLINPINSHELVSVLKSQNDRIFVKDNNLGENIGILLNKSVFNMKKEDVEKNIYLFNAFQYMTPWQKHVLISLCLDLHVDEKYLSLLNHPFFKGYSLYKGIYQPCISGFRFIKDKGHVIYEVKFFVNEEEINASHIFLDENTISVNNSSCFEEASKYGITVKEDSYGII